MSTFTTNNNTRRTKRARVQHNRRDTKPYGSTGPSSSLTTDDLVFSKHGQDRKIVETVIGAPNSKSLTIRGGMAALDFNHGQNPDQRTVPLALHGDSGGLVDGEQNWNLGYPPFPISFDGPGYLEFQSPVSLPSILGPVHLKGNTVINGNVQITGSLTVDSGTLPEDPFVPVIQDALGNELTGVVTQSLYISDTTKDYFEVLIAWTSFGDLDPTEDIRLTGFPLTNYSVTSAPEMTGQGGIATTAIGGKFTTLCTPGQSYLVLEEVDQSAGTAPTPLLGANFFSAGEIRIHGHVRKT